MSWLLIRGSQNLSLESEIEQKAQASLLKNNFSPASLEYLSKLDRSISISAGSDVQADVLTEKLRAMCKFWDVDPTVGQISSHRKYIGPVIVRIKKAFFSIMKVMLKPTLEKQRNFNAQVIEFLAEVAKSKIQ